MAAISDQAFSSALEFEQALVEAAFRGELVLTATSRLSRRLLHCFRLARIKKGEEGWKTPAIFGFNRWVKNTYESLWEPFQPLSRLAALRLWDEATQGVKWMEELRPGPFLYLELQDSFDLLMRSGQPLVGSPSGHMLADWRREVFGHFLDLLEKNRYVPWGNILKRVGEALAEGRISLPQNIILAGFNEFSPIEESLVKSLSEKSKIYLYRTSKSPDENVRVRVYATPEQECQSVCAEVIECWNKKQRRLGVVFLDPDYFKLFKQPFEELTDREERPPDALRYNLTGGTPLSEHPLFQTALLPLRLSDEPQPNGLLSSLLFSPYARRIKQDQELAVRSTLWGQNNSETLANLLFRLSHIGCPVQPLRNLCFYKKKPLKVWLEELENLWKNLGFPLLRCETDTLAKEHLLMIVENLKSETGHLEMGRKDVLAWLNAASRGIEVVEKTPETAGIQILNLVESRGLAFDRVWVVGAHGRALPQMMGDLPFLDSDELRKIEGGTAEGQWETGQRNLSCLLASAPDVTFSRAASRGEDFPYLPCPLIPDESSQEGSQYTVDLWKRPPMEWLRARWLREGLKGLESISRESKERVSEYVNYTLTGQMRVTQFEDLLLCPFKYFAGHLLALGPLEELKIGIDPGERGEVIHKILREFTRGLAKAAPDWPDEKGKALEFLVKTIDTILGDKMKDPFWMVERLRLLGNDQFPGLLKTWLDVEQERALAGWRFEAAEESFEGLSIGETGISLRGRLDRIDSHPEKGKALWDYKTGDPPNSKEVTEWMVRPQLPAYLLAIKKGLLSRLGGWKGGTEAGYISLKRVSEVKVRGLEKVDWDNFLEKWIEGVSKRLEGPLKGVYSPDPLPPPSTPQNEGGCKHCPFPNICGLDEQREEEGDPSWEEE
ncbi:MAG: PD-(D/E)XK nuclease family protein [Thermodesulfobacteriota bacterium]|nr:PD-(D/E)XK nuclease family protein [Thermodesulfobacteriota bacterium]